MLSASVDDKVTQVGLLHPQPTNTNPSFIENPEVDL
jgi:hypothetical protein